MIFISYIFFLFEMWTFDSNNAFHDLTAVRFDGDRRFSFLFRGDFAAFAHRGNFFLLL